MRAGVDFTLQSRHKKHADVGAVIIGGTSEQFHAYLKSEVAKFGKLVKSAGIKAAAGG